MPNILAFAEPRAGAIRKAAFEAVTAARAAADAAGGGEVHALLVGAPGITAKAARLGEHGADVVIVAEHPAFERHNPEATAALAAARITSGGSGLAVFSSTAQGRDLGPRVAAILDAAI